jgi:hypothetical protein
MACAVLVHPCNQNLAEALLTAYFGILFVHIENH